MVNIKRTFMTEKFLIRNADPNDFGDIEYVLVLANEEYEQQLPPHVWKLWRENVNETIHSGTGEFLVGVCGEAIVAFVQFYIDASESTMDEWPKGSACIRMLSVLPEFRGRGYGAALTKECINRARAKKISSLYLQTGRIMHAAKRLYEKLGFKRDARFDEKPFGPEDHTFAYRYDLDVE